MAQGSPKVFGTVYINGAPIACGSTQATQLGISLNNTSPQHFTECIDNHASFLFANFNNTQGYRTSNYQLYYYADAYPGYSVTWTCTSKDRNTGEVFTDQCQSATGSGDIAFLNVTTYRDTADTRIDFSLAQVDFGTPPLPNTPTPIVVVPPPPVPPGADTPTPIVLFPPPEETPTITNPASASIRLKFQGIASERPDKSVKIILTKNTLVKYWFNNVSIVSDSNGIYTGTITDIEADTYDVHVTGWAHLRNKFSGIVLTSGENTIDLTGTPLIAGDVAGGTDGNGDNKLNIIDISRLVTDYYPDTPVGSIADLNLDGTVNVIDIGMIIDNFGDQGDQSNFSFAI